MRSISLSLFAAALAFGAAPAHAQNGLASHGNPDRVVLSNGRTWERVRLQYMDVRVLTAPTGAPNLATEYDLMRMRYGGGMPMGGGYAGYGSFGMGGFGGAGMGGPMMPGGGAGPFGGRALYGDPGSNSLILGPAFGGRGGMTGGNRLFPGLIILGDPNTNSLIVDP